LHRSALHLVAEGFDLDVHTGRKLELHQGIHRLAGRLENVEQAFVGSNLELLTRLLVDVRAAIDRVPSDMVGNGIGPTTRAPVRRAVSTISPVDASRIR
jgi:hypothetical protein